MTIKERAREFLAKIDEIYDGMSDEEFFTLMEEAKAQNDESEERKKIYAITCIENIREERGFPVFSGSAFMGWYSDKETAIEAVENNACDINETIYRYAVVEEIEEGLYVYPRKRWLFKYEDNRYHLCEEPDCMKIAANVL